MADIVRYVNTDALPGGTGLTADSTGTDRGYATLLEALTAEQNTGGTGDTLYVYCSGSVPDTQAIIGTFTVEHLVIEGNNYTGIFDYSKYHFKGWPDYKYAINITGADYITIRNLYMDGEGRFVHGMNTCASNINTVIENCVVYNLSKFNSTNAFRMPTSGQSTEYKTIRNCIAIKIGGTAFSTSGYVNCVLSGCLAYDCAAGITLTAEARRVILENNIIFNCSVESITDPATVTVGPVNINNNAFENDPSVTTAYVTVANPITVTDFPAEFRDVPTYDFRLASTSVFIGGGITTTYNLKDITGGTRPDPPAVGPYEYAVVGIPRTVTFTGLADNTEVRVYRVDDDTEVTGIENTSGGEFVGSYTFYSQPIEVYYHVHHLNYRFIRNASYFLPDADITIPIQQLRDLTYKNPE